MSENLEFSQDRYVKHERIQGSKIYFYRAEANVDDETIYLTMDSDEAYVENEALIVPQYLWSTRGKGIAIKAGNKEMLATKSFVLSTSACLYGFAVYSADDNSLEFYRGVAPEIGDTYNNKIVTDLYFDFELISATAQKDLPWDSIRSDIKTVSFDESFAKVRPISTSFWFCYLDNCESIDLTNLDTSEVTQMQQMLRGCPKITSLDLSGMNVDKVERTSNMMIGDSALETLNICGWNTGEMLYMNAFVRECTSLKTIYADRDFEISSNLSNDANMFYSCTSLVGGNGTKFDSSKVTSSMAKIDREGVEGYFTAK